MGNVGDYAASMTQHLSTELHNTGLAGAGLLLALAGGIGLLESWPFAALWLVQSTALWALAWQQTWVRRDLNRATALSPLYPALGLANQLTILRGMLIAATGGFLLQTPDNSLLLWIAAALYSVAAILDRVDGFVARRTGQTTLLGSDLDTVFDALGLVIAPLLAVILGKVHISYLLVSVAYYLFSWARERRLRLGLPVYPLLPNTLRRTLAGFQMGYVAVVLWPPFQAPLTVLAGIAFMVPLLTGFVVDWLVVSGRIDSQSPRTAQRFAALADISASIVQPLLRVLLLSALGWLCMQATASATLPLSVYGGFAVGAVLILLGFGARIGALIVLLVLAWSVPFALSSPLLHLLLLSTTGVLLLGSGQYSLWQGDDHWIARHDGAA